jgi:hypothetical protein
VIVQSAGTTPNKAEVTSSNLFSPYCANMSKKKKKKTSSTPRVGKQNGEKVINQPLFAKNNKQTNQLI